MGRESLLAQAQSLLDKMKLAAAGADFTRVTELNIQLKALLAQWAQARREHALTTDERACLNEMQTDMQALTAQCEKARDLSVEEGKTLAANRDAAELYRQSARLKG